jgi:aminoglycoside phosphotransferase
VTSTKLSALDESSAGEALAEACLHIEVDCSDAELIRIGSNATFRLRDNVIARVGRSRQLEPVAQREVMVSRWLKASGIPAVQALPVEQPILTSDRVVTFWESLGDVTTFGSTADLAQLLRGVHNLGWKAELPQHDPFSRVQQRLAAADHLEKADRDFLLTEFDRLLDAYSQITYDLPVGVIHGDANVGNVLVDRDGVARLADLDGFSIGPREWDLILTAMYFERYGWHTAHEYQSFVDSYGFDIRGWSGYRTLSDVREFLMVTWLTQNAETNPEARRELDKRIVALKNGASRMDWLPL